MGTSPEAKAVKVSKQDELAAFQSNLYLHKRVMIVTEFQQVTGTVFMVVPGILFLNDANYKVFSRHDDSTVLDLTVKTMEITIAQKTIAVLED